MSVKAYAAHAVGNQLEPFKYDPPSLGPHDVEIAVTHCGICHSDIHMIDNDWGITHYPLVPGHEIVGTIAGVGREVKSLKRGERVGVGWQSGSCMECEWCIRGDENCCSKEEGVIVGRPGGFADSVRVDGRFAFPIPDELDSATAAPLLCGGATVYTPLKDHARPAMRVGVIGIGGLGHMALRFARAFGCEVTAFSTTEAKAEEARVFGAHHFVLSTDANQMGKAVKSLDLLLSAVTVKMNWAQWLALLRPKGTLALLGASPGVLDIAPMALITGKQTIRGSAIGNRSTIREMLEFAARHKVTAQTEVVPMAEVNAALEKVRRNEARYRMVLKNK